MVTFWLLAALLFVIATAFILYPFYAKIFKSSAQQSPIDQRQINIDIAQDQLQTLNNNFAANEISKEEYDSLKYELETSLIDDLDTTDSSADNLMTQTFNSADHKFTIALVALFIPICSILLYQKLGTPDLIVPGAVQSSQQHGKGNNQPSVDEMINMLITKLKENPNDSKGWFLLARTYMALEKYQQAYQVYEKLLPLTKNENGDEDPAVLVSMADALAMTLGGKITGGPEKLIHRALKVSPNNITGLWLAGIAEREKANNKQALVYWYKLYPLLNDDADARKSIANMIVAIGGSVPKGDLHDHKNAPSADMMTNLASEIQSAQKAPSETTASETATKTSNKSPSAENSISVTIVLSDEFVNQVSANDMVFIYAKALSGPPMPLAAVKKKVSDLPITITLDDSMAMMPSMKISSFKQVKVGARISKSGQPIKQAGDLMSEEVNVDLSNVQAVSLTINSIVN